MTSDLHMYVMACTHTCVYFFKTFLQAGDTAHLTEYLPHTYKTLGLIPTITQYLAWWPKSIYNPNTEGVEAGESGYQGDLWSHNEYKASPDYMRLSQKSIQGNFKVGDSILIFNLICRGKSLIQNNGILEFLPNSGKWLKTAQYFNVEWIMTFIITPISGARNVKSQNSQKRDQLENMAQQVMALASKPDDLSLIPGTSTMKRRWQLPKIVSGLPMSTIAFAHAHEHRHTKINERFSLEKGINGCLPYHARWPEFNPPDPHTERREPTPTSCALVHVCTVYVCVLHIHMHKHTNMHKQINIFKIKF